MLVIDARGLQCPWPALRLARSLRDHASGAVEIYADDPNAARELEAVAAAQHARFEIVAEHHFRVER